MICFSTHFNETCQTFGEHKLWNQVLIILCNIKQDKSHIPDLGSFLSTTGS